MPVQFCSGFSTRKMEGRNKVCRNLFGAPNHEELRKDLDNQLKEIATFNSMHMKKTWNFDPEMDSGLIDGRYEWSVVNSQEYVPECYTKPYRPTKFRSARRIAERPTSHLVTPPSSPICPSPVAVLARLQGSVTSSEDQFVEDMENLRRENETTPENRIMSVRQTRIGDYMKVKKPSLKRRLEDSNDDEPSAKSQRH